MDQFAAKHRYNFKIFPNKLLSLQTHFFHFSTPKYMPLSVIFNLNKYFKSLGYFHKHFISNIHFSYISSTISLQALPNAYHQFYTSKTTILTSSFTHLFIKLTLLNNFPNITNSIIQHHNPFLYFHSNTFKLQTNLSYIISQSMFHSLSINSSGI